MESLATGQEMNIVKFSMTPIVNRSYPAVEIIIDGILLAVIMKEIEKPMAEKDGHPELAGKYGSIDAPGDPVLYFLGEDRAYWGEHEDKTVILDCTCGVSSCWPLLCKIKVFEGFVVWAEFEHWHRDWDYSGFKGFVFSKEQYFEALRSIGYKSLTRVIH